MDLSQSRIIVTLTQQGLMGRMRPTHTVAAKSFSGKVEISPRNETDLKVELNAESRSLENIDKEMAEIERREFQNVLRNVVLEVDKFPTIKFASTSVTNVKSSGDNRTFTLTGDLNLHGVTKSVSFPVNVNMTKDQLRATGEAKLKQSDYGIKPYEGGFGLIKIGDEVKVAFTVVAKAI